MNWSEGMRRVYKVYLVVSLVAIASIAYVQYQDVAENERDRISCFKAIVEAQTKPWCNSYTDYSQTPSEVKILSDNERKEIVSRAALIWLGLAFFIAVFGKVCRYILRGFKSQ